MELFLNILQVIGTVVGIVGAAVLAHVLLGMIGL